MAVAHSIPEHPDPEYFYVPRAVLHDRKLSSKAKALLITFIALAPRQPQYRELCSHLGISRSSLVKYMAELRASGYIVGLPTRQKRQLPPALWIGLLRAYNFHCAYCGVESNALIQEHVVPRRRGGETSLANIVPACQSCNRRKGSEIWVPRRPGECDDGCL